jgi:hypothetical protein
MIDTRVAPGSEAAESWSRRNPGTTAGGGAVRTAVLSRATDVVIIPVSLHIGGLAGRPAVTCRNGAEAGHGLERVLSAQVANIPVSSYAD